MAVAAADGEVRPPRFGSTAPALGLWASTFPRLAEVDLLRISFPTLHFDLTIFASAFGNRSPTTLGTTHSGWNGGGGGGGGGGAGGVRPPADARDVEKGRRR